MRIAGKASAALLLATLVVTLAPKAMFVSYRQEEDFARLDRDIARRLAEQGFKVTRRSEISRPPTFYARRDSCRVMIRQATDPASFDRKYRHNAKSIGALVYRIGSSRYHTPPLLRLWIADKWHVARMRLGYGTPRSPALAVAMSAACPPDAVPTTDLRIHPGSRS
jgi:hypothetical protein